VLEGSGNAAILIVGCGLGLCRLGWAHAALRKRCVAEWWVPVVFGVAFVAWSLAGLIWARLSGTGTAGAITLGATGGWRC